MPTNIRVVTGTLPGTIGATVDYTVSGFGTVQAAIVIASTAFTTGNPTANACLSVGYWTSANQRALGIYSGDALADTDTSVQIRTDSVVHNRFTTVRRNWSASAVTDGIRITADGATSTALRYCTVILINGITNATVGTINLGTGTDGINISTGYRADLVLTLAHMTAAVNTDIITAAPMSFGAAHFNSADAVSQACVNFAEADNAANGDAETIVRNDCAALKYLDGTETWKATFAPHASGFTVTPSANSSSNVIAYLALELNDPDDAYVGVVDTKNTTGTKAYTGAGFEPQAVLMGVTLNTAVNTAINSGAISIGVGGEGASGLAQRAIGISAEYGSATTDTENYCDIDSAFYLKTDAGAVEGVADLQTLDSDGWTLDFTDATASVYKMLAIAMGDSTAAATAPTLSALTAISITSTSAQPSLTYAY